MNARRTASVARVPVLVAVGAIVVGLVAADHAGHGPTSSIHVAARPVSGPSVPPPNAISSTWYCAEGTSNPGGRTNETVIVANLARRAVTATITVVSGADQKPVSRSVRVDALAQRRVPVSSLVVDAEPGVIVGSEATPRRSAPVPGRPRRAGTSRPVTPGAARSNGSPCSTRSATTRWST